MKTHLIACVIACASQGHVLSATVSAPSTQWTPLVGNYDHLVDQQTGIPDGDIVGQGTDYGFLVTYNSAGPGGSPVPTFGFRLRLDAPGGNANDIRFNRAAWLGIDADLNGSIDVFLGVDMSGSANLLGIYSPGTGANTSPSTTSISSTAYLNYTIGNENYNYRPVDYLTDGGTSNDLTPGKKDDDPDYYVSVLVPFEDVVEFLGGKNITINESSPLRYVSATATQNNSLNQDLGGVQGGVNSTTTWTELGGFSPIMTATGTAIPEPKTEWLGALGFLLLLRRRRAAA